MIDRKARNATAEATRHYLTGNATNFVFDDTLFDLRSGDPAIDAIRKQLWLIYDDLREHKCEGQWKLPAAQRAVAIRTIAFLKTDFEYEWPAVPGWYSGVRPLIWLLSLGFGTRALDKEFAFEDLEDVWPFRTQDQLQAAISDPKYLARAT